MDNNIIEFNSLIHTGEKLVNEKIGILQKNRNRNSKT